MLTASGCQICYGRWAGANAGAQGKTREGRDCGTVMSIACHQHKNSREGIGAI